MDWRKLEAEITDILTQRGVEILQGPDRFVMLGGARVFNLTYFAQALANRIADSVAHTKVN